jgi:polar amino acid transport system permease protein
MLGTSIISAIGAEDLTALANEIQSANFRILEVYIVCAIIYSGLPWDGGAYFASSTSNCSPFAGNSPQSPGD